MMSSEQGTLAIGNGHIDGARVREIAVLLTSWPSETGTPGEMTFANRLLDFLGQLPYFAKHPFNLRLIPSHAGTSSIVALVRGKGSRTLLLAGHFDTASTENYGNLRDVAVDPEHLAARLVDELSGRSRRTAQEETALGDLRSGEFLPGRGLLDMKAGIAAAIACLETFADDPDRGGNLLLVATPDEERESRGMRSLRNALPDIAAHYGLVIAGGLNLDATSDQGDGSEGRAVYKGTIGKLLPFAHVLGTSSHASYPFEGVSAALIGASIIARLEGNVALCDRDSFEISPAPICLEAKDLRSVYEVTTPDRFWIAFNWLYHSMTARELFRRFREQVAIASREAAERFATQAVLYRNLAGHDSGTPLIDVEVIDWPNLKKRAAAKSGPSFEALYAQRERNLSEVDNPLTLTRLLVDWTASLAGIVGPCVVVGFAGLHYPASRLLESEANDRALVQAIEAARSDRIGNPDETMVWKNIFKGISDMSFLGLVGNEDPVVLDNTPVSHLVDMPSMKALRFPVVNIGPWGREFHQRLERIHQPYSFFVLPNIILDVAQSFLKQASLTRT